MNAQLAIYKTGFDRNHYSRAFFNFWKVFKATIISPIKPLDTHLKTNGFYFGFPTTKPRILK